MSQSIRSLTPKTCPACGTVGRFARVNGQMTCQVCGYTATSTASASPFTAPITHVDDEPPPAPIAPIEDPTRATQTGEFKRIKPKFKTTTSETPVVPPASPPSSPAEPESAPVTGEVRRVDETRKTSTSERPITPLTPRPMSAPIETPPAKVPRLPIKPKAATTYSAARLEQLKSFPVTEVILHADTLSAWVRAIYSTGLQHLRQQQWAEAVKAFKRAVDEEHDFVDAHLWLARLSLDEKNEREHLSLILALVPNHVEAMTRMMVLNGQMSEAEAARALNPHNNPVEQEADAPVNTSAKLMKCPNCGGTMRAGDDGESVVCEACGHSEARIKAQDYGFKSLSMAVLKQRGQTVQWIVGERLLKCQTCGAERTLQHGAFSERCLFCGSSYVVQTDALGSFQQPDGMLKFSVNRQQAGKLVEKALNSGLERVKGWFVNNDIGRLALETLYVPFWLFDLTLDVKRTFTRKTSYNQSALERARHISLPAVRYDTFSEMAHDVPVPASKEVDLRLISKTGGFIVDRVQPYQPDLLASHSALIYSLPFDKAALMARQMTSERMRLLYEESTSEEDVRVSVFFQQAMFRLVLMPFWVVAIVEQDGDLRPGLINGQTGAIALGKTHKPKM